MRRNPLTPEIILETLKRSRLNTILVEGSDDMEIYGKISNKLGARNVDFFPCGGKNTLFKIFEKKDQICNAKIMFIADADFWIFSEIPKEYKDIFFTNGYCIENDLFDDGCSLVLNILSNAERKKFYEIIYNVCEWFAFEIEQVDDSSEKNNLFCDITILSTSVIKKNHTKLCEEFLIKRNYVAPNDYLLENIKNNYKLKLRGKFIFQIIEKLFQERNSIKAVTYQRRQLFDLCFIEGTKDPDRESNMNRIIKEIQTFMA